MHEKRINGALKCTYNNNVIISKYCALLSAMLASHEKRKKGRERERERERVIFSLVFSCDHITWRNHIITQNIIFNHFGVRKIF